MHPIRRHKKALLILVFFALVVSLPGQSAHSIEVTKQSFTATSKLSSTMLTTFGVALGMTREQVTTILKDTNATLMVTPTYKDNESLDISSSSAKTLVVVTFANGTVTSITWQETLKTYLVGRDRELLNPDIVLPDSPSRLQLLGREDSARTEDLSTTNLKATITTFSYDREGFQLVSSVIGKESYVSIRLIAPARSR